MMQTSLQWDPLLIVSQIVTLQSVFYLALSATLFVLTTAIGTPVSLEQIFESSTVLLDKGIGVVTLCALPLASTLWYAGPRPSPSLLPLVPLVALTHSLTRPRAARWRWW